MHVIEGTWEEVKRHDAELAGRQVRIIVVPERSARPKRVASARNTADTAPIKQLRGRGMFAGILSTEEYLCEKREDTAREERAF